MFRFGHDTRIRFIGGDIRLRVQGQDYLTDDLKGIVKRSTDLRVPFEAFRPIWIDAIQETFDAGGDPVPWPELSPAYAGWKANAYPGQPILRLTDRMYDSLTSQTSDTIWDVGPRSMRLGSRVPYFIYHQEGTRNMPARPMLTLPAEAAASLVTMIVNWVKSGRTNG